MVAAQGRGRREHDLSNADAFHDQDDRARHERIKAPRPYRFGSKRPIEGLPEALPDRSSLSRRPAGGPRRRLPPDARSTAPASRPGRGPVPRRRVLLSGAMPSGIGYGATDERGDDRRRGRDRREPDCPSLAVLPRRQASGRATRGARGRRSATSVADPLTLCLPAGSPVDRDTVLEWTPAVAARHGEVVLVPLDIAATDYFELSAGYQPFTTLITNGLGAGPDVRLRPRPRRCWNCCSGTATACCSGPWTRASMLDLDGDSARRTRALLARLRGPRHRRAAEIRHRRVRPRQPLLRRLRRAARRARRVPIMLSACGEACDPDRERALRKALLEFRPPACARPSATARSTMAASGGAAGLCATRSSRRPCRASTARRAGRCARCSTGSACDGATCAACSPTPSVPSAAPSASPSCPPDARLADGHARGQIACDAARRGRVRRPLRRLLAARRRGSAWSRRSCRGSRSRP